MLRKLRKLNNNSDSLFITLPMYFVDFLKLEKGQNIDISIKGKKLIIDTDVKQTEEE